MIKKVIFKSVCITLKTKAITFIHIYRGEESRPSLFDQ